MSSELRARHRQTAASPTRPPASGETLKSWLLDLFSSYFSTLSNSPKHITKKNKNKNRELGTQPRRSAASEVQPGAALRRRRLKTAAEGSGALQGASKLRRKSPGLSSRLATYVALTLIGNNERCHGTERRGAS